VQTFENILLSLFLAYAKYYPYLIIRGNSGANKTVVKIAYNTWHSKQSDMCLNDQSRLWN
jgi:hypothetical protein